MKKHIVLIMNTVLIALIFVALVFTVMNIINRNKSDASDATEPNVSATEAPTELPSAAPGERYKVGVVRHGLDKDSDSCYAGFISQLNTRGLLDHVDIVYIIENNDQKCIEKIGELVEEGCDLIYAIGPFAAKYSAAATQEIPIVFAAVVDPEEMGLVDSNEAPGGNVTGVAGYTPCFEQIDLIPVLLPKADSVAAIYNATDEDAVRQAIIACREAEDFRYTTDRYPISSKDDLMKSLAEIKEKGTDVIYLPIDKMVQGNINTIVAFSQENGIPVICGNRSMLKSGCLATCEINYTSIGRRCADLSLDVLLAKKDPASISVIYKYDCYNIVNKQTLEMLNIQLTAVAKANVEIVDCSK